MDSFTHHLRGIIEVELASACRLADVETWHGPKADAVRSDLMRVARMLTDATHLTRVPTVPRLESTVAVPRRIPWGS